MASRETMLHSLGLLQTQHPNIAATDLAIEAWGAVLGRFTDEQVRLGIELTMRYHTYGPPTAAHVTEMILGKETKMLTESTYAVCYRTEQRFAWEERGDPPPGGLTNEDARAALLAAPERAGLPAGDRTDEGAGSPRGVSALLREGE